MFKNNLFFRILPNFIHNKLLSTNAILIKNIFKNHQVGDFIKIKGWVKSLRNQKENIFIDVSDGSSNEKLQVFIPKTLKPDDLSTGSSLIASGSLSLSPKGQLELKANEIQICGKCVVADGYPFAPRKQYESEYVRQHLHMRPRTNKFSSLLRVRSQATLAIHNHFNAESFINIHTPVLTSNDCEGAGEVFKALPENKNLLKSMLKQGQAEDEIYFNTKAFLTVSGQLHLEAAAHALSKVYCFGPTFRAENSRSRLHLSEFYMVEAEIAFAEKLSHILECVEKLLKSTTTTLLNQSAEDIKNCQENENNSLDWVNKQFPVLTFQEACTILNENKENYREKFNPSVGFAKEHEIFLVKHCGNVPTFVINWPKEMKPFYMKEENGVALAFDLLAPNVGEIVGGSLREDNFDKLKNKIPSNESHLNWYLDLRKFGGVPTGGFGLGFERYIQSILGINNIKDSIPFPRWPHNCSL